MYVDTYRYLNLLSQPCGNFETAVKQAAKQAAGGSRRLVLTLIKSLNACCAQTTDQTDVKYMYTNADTPKIRSQRRASIYFSPGTFAFIRVCLPLLVQQCLLTECFLPIRFCFLHLVSINFRVSILWLTFSTGHSLLSSSLMYSARFLQ